jgi:hypothetical protein
MDHAPKKPSLRLPEKLAFTAFHVAIAATLACAGTSSTGPTADASPDAAADASVDATDGPSADACSTSFYCGPTQPDGSCPGFVCGLDQCPLDAGCEPYA